MSDTPVAANDPIKTYWQRRFDDLKEVLESNNFEVFTADTCEEAGTVFLNTILPHLQESQDGAKTVAFGGSMTLMRTGLVEKVKELEGLEVIDTFDKSIPRPEMYERRRHALLSDIFLTGTNALTEDGQLVNLDMIGNRVCAINFGPRHVVLFISRNKIVSDLDEAIHRIRNYASPVNAMRLDLKTPCRKTGRCMDCNSPSRICNIWTVTEKSFPKGRIRIVLINEDAGY